jgi:hypothetical protein
MRADTDLEALRRRDDFQKLLQDLEAKAAAGRPKDDAQPTQEKP